MNVGNVLLDFNSLTKKASSNVKDAVPSPLVFTGSPLMFTGRCKQREKLFFRRSQGGGTEMKSTSYQAWWSEFNP